MKTLFLAWQDCGTTRSWFPIGRLDADVQKSRYKFLYTHGAETAHNQVGLNPLDSFPDFNKVYESSELFPLFQNRVVTAGRGDFPEYLRQLDLDPNDAGPLEILSVTGGRRQTDSLEVFPKIHRNADGGFHCRFFLHGWSHVNADSKRKLENLKAEDPLIVSVELNNPVCGLALQLETVDYHMIGWAPRYLVSDLVKAIGESPTRIVARVVQVNPAPAPARQRYLICLSGHWPLDYEPMSHNDFQPLIEPIIPEPFFSTSI